MCILQQHCFITAARRTCASRLVMTRLLLEVHFEEVKHCVHISVHSGSLGVAYSPSCLQQQQQAHAWLLVDTQNMVYLLTSFSERGCAPAHASHAYCLSLALRCLR